MPRLIHVPGFPGTGEITGKVSNQHSSRHARVRPGWLENDTDPSEPRAVLIARTRVASERSPRSGSLVDLLVGARGRDALAS